MIIPNKSTIAEEEITVPFGGREGEQRGILRGGEDYDSPTSSRPGSADGTTRMSVQSAQTNTPLSPGGRSPLDRLASSSFGAGAGGPQTTFGVGGGLSGLNALSANPNFAGNRTRSDDEDPEGSDGLGGLSGLSGREGAGRGGGTSDYYDRVSLGRASVQSDASGRGAGRVRQVRTCGSNRTI